jgi:hypothetical protein
MNVRYFSDAKGYFEIARQFEHPGVCERIFFGKLFFEVLLTLPLAAAYKLVRSFFKATGVLLMPALVLATLGLSQGFREMFLKRVSILAVDLADWILYPLALFTCLFRLLLASLIHPSLFSRY